MNIRAVALLVVLLAEPSVFASDKGLYKKAVGADTVDAYQEYLDRYPDGKFSEEATRLLAKAADTVDAYQGYLDRYPDGKFSKELSKLQFERATKDGDPTFAVARVISERTSWIKYNRTGKSLVTLGRPAIMELIRALDYAAPSDRGYIALALGLFGSEAEAAIPKLIESFPTKPIDKVAIRLDGKPTEQEIATLVDNFGRGSLVQQVAGMSVPLNSDGTPDMTAVKSGSITYFFEFEAPAAAAALYEITGLFPGTHQRDWREWLEADESR